MNKVILQFKRLLAHELVSGSAFLFIGGMVTNVLAFILNLVLVRNLSYSQYGEYSALVSLFTLAVIPAQSLVPVIVQFSSKYITRKETDKANSFYHVMLRFLFVVGLVAFAAFFIGAIPLQKFLHISELRFVVLIGMAVGIFYLGIANIAYLQSLLKFNVLSFTTFLGGLVKLGVGVLLIIAGFRVDAALWAVILSIFIPFLVSFAFLKSFIFAKEKNQPTSAGEVLGYALPTMITVFAMSSFTSTDILLVKHFFSTNEAGLYGGLSLIGRIIFYFTAPIATVMFPLIIGKYEKKEPIHGIFNMALFLVALPSLFLTLVYFLVPNLIIQVILGGKGYLAVVPYIGWFGVYLTVFSLLNIVVSLFLSLRKTVIAYAVVVGAFLQAIGIILFHNNFTQVIAISTGVSLMLLIILTLYYQRAIKR